MRTPEWNPKAPKVPVDKEGNFLHYPSYEHDDWYDIPEPFFAVMSISKMTNGRSAKYLNLVDERGKEYPMFVSDLVKGITEQTLTVNGGHLVGYWTGSKRGSNYGIKTVKQ